MELARLTDSDLAVGSEATRNESRSFATKEGGYRHELHKPNLSHSVNSKKHVKA